MTPTHADAATPALQPARPILRQILLAAHQLHLFAQTPQFGYTAANLLRMTSVRLGADESTQADAARCNILARCVLAGTDFTAEVNNFLALVGHGPDVLTDTADIDRLLAAFACDPAPPATELAGIR